MKHLHSALLACAAIGGSASSAHAQQLFGSSCAGGSGVTPTLSVSGTVATGQTWFLDVTAPGGIGLGYLLIGFSNTTASVLGGLPLPFDLGILFADPLWSGCPLNVDANYQISTYFFNPAVNGGLAQIQFPGFSAGMVYMQVLNIDPNFVTRIAGVSRGIEIVPTPPAGGGLVITEIMKNPAFVSDNNGEYFEVLNTTASPIDVEGWTLRDDGIDSVVLANGGNGIVIAPGQYFVFGVDDNSATNGGITVDFDYGTSGDFAIAQADDEIVLENLLAVEVARVNYESVTFPNITGVAMELGTSFLNEVDNDDGANWENADCDLSASNSDQGTPGIDNDDCNTTATPGTGALIVTEFMKDPAVINDNFGEWFEVKNTTGAPIDMNGYTVTCGAPFTVTGSFVIPAGGYGVFLRDGDPFANGGLDPLVLNAYDAGGVMFLAQAGGTIVIQDTSANVVVNFSYDDGITFPDSTGVSAILDPSVTQDLATSLVGSNWCLSTTTYIGDGFSDTAGLVVVTNVSQRGTPSGPNDACPITPFGTPSGQLIFTEIMSNPAADSDTPQEWFEVHNTTGSGIDINGWIIADVGSDYHVIQNGGPLVVPAGGRLSLAQSTVSALNGGISTHDYEYGSTVFLGNGSDTLILANASGAIVARADYDAGVTWPAVNGGHSLILDPSVALTAAAAGNGANWCRSFFTSYGSEGNFGTPGANNDPCEIIPSGSATGALVVTEFLNNGTGAELEEFIEIFNTTVAPIDIEGWILADQDADYHIIQNGGPLFVPAGGYITLGRTNVLADNGGVTHAYVYGTLDFFLSNSPDEIVLANAAGQIVAQIAYDEGVTYPLSVECFSLILDPLVAKTQVNSANGANWCLSTTGFGDLTCAGSPAAANEACGGGPVGGTDANPGDLIVTEFMQNPLAKLDSDGEWFEVYNTTASPINLDGWTFRDDGGNTFTVVGTVVVPANGYAVLSEESAATAGLASTDYDYPSAFVLANGDDEIIIEDVNGQEIFRIEYDGGPVWPDGNGASAQLDASAGLNAAAAAAGTNWSLTPAGNTYLSGDLGTPDAANL
jgi:hypothetical protein